MNTSLNFTEFEYKCTTIELSISYFDYKYSDVNDRHLSNIANNIAVRNGTMSRIVYLNLKIIRIT